MTFFFFNFFYTLLNIFTLIPTSSGWVLQCAGRGSIPNIYIIEKMYAENCTMQDLDILETSILKPKKHIQGKGTQKSGYQTTISLLIIKTISCST